MGAFLAWIFIKRESNFAVESEIYFFCEKETGSKHDQKSEA